MSDFEDEMDVDAPSKGDIQFTSDNASKKAKRPAADLPVEAQDNLPWVEKYRPNTLDDVSGHQDILATINKFVEANRLPHLLLYGPPGTGKTSTILALARKIYGQKNMRQMVLELNASDDRGIDVVREQIKTFASTKQIFSMAPQSNTSGSALGAFKLIILDEADAMTSTAQMALRRIMEKYTANTRFCIIANYTHKLSPALLSRCTRFRFSPLKEQDIRALVDLVIEKEQIKIQPDAIDSLVTLSKGDMRRALNVLQACHASSIPLPMKNAPKDQTPPESEMITNETIYDCIAAPHPSDIQQIMTTLLATSDVTSCLNTLNTLKANKGLALADILEALGSQLQRLEVPAQTRITWLEGLAEIEWRLAGGGSEVMQTGKTDNFVSNETYVAGITAVQVWEYLVDVTKWELYYDNIGQITPPTSGPRLAQGDEFSFSTFGFPPLRAKCGESVAPTTSSPGRLGWHAWQEGDESIALDIYHTWIVEDMNWGVVRILTQESQIGKPAAQLAKTKPNPMLNGHQAWIEGLAHITKRSFL
ncbi:hypothetical protein FE257_000923 [Aspergillus nanangensis]|uniref:Replication factor C subunit 3 n=1 Tax=Aspergillus nanangensis TaxID=2582783 RepID=A0AAD4CEN1_ASPNN|nr:hypothetical protein FE257_000923 [Aspergillus nanangensis]